jgi:hypothetical protein
MVGSEAAVAGTRAALWHCSSCIRAATSDVHQARLDHVEVSESDRIPVLAGMVDRDPLKRGALAGDLVGASQHLGDATVVGFDHDETREFLNDSRLPAASLGTAIAHLCLKLISEL